MDKQLTHEQAYAYAELLEILEFTDKNLVDKLPNKLLNIFQTYALPDYKNHLDNSIPLEEQNVSKKTAALIALLSLNYCCNSEEEKEELKQILMENERLREQELREKYNPDNIFNNSNNSQKEVVFPTNKNTFENSLPESSNLPIDYSSLPWYKKFFVSIKKFLFKILKKENNPT